MSQFEERKNTMTTRKCFTAVLIACVLICGCTRLTVEPTTGNPPSVPTLSSPSEGASSISLTPTLVWSDTSVVNAYHLQVAIDSAFKSLIINDSTLTSASMTITSSLANNTKYYWRVQAKNAGGMSSWTGAWCFTTIVAAPLLPTLSFPANGAKGCQSMLDTLAWSPVSGATSYHVQVSTDSNFASILIEDSTLASASKALNGLAFNTIYYWRVQAKNAGGVSGYTNSWSFTRITSQTPILTSPANGAIGQSLTPTLTWSTVSDAVTYHAQVSIDSAFGSLIPKSVRKTLAF